MSPQTLAARRRRRSRRTQRHVKSVSVPHSGYSPRRCQPRHRAFAPVEDCLDPCQNQILPLEPDTRVGAAVGISGDRFSVLESFERHTSLPTITPTRNNLPPSQTLLDFGPQDCLAKLGSPESTFSQRTKDEVASIQSTIDDLSSYSNVPSNPLMPPDTVEAQVAEPCLSKSDEINVRPEPSTSLHDFSIPSPLLYHKKSREDLLRFEGNWNLNDTKASMIYGQESSVPGCGLETFTLGAPLHQAVNNCRQSQIQSDHSAELPTLDYNHESSFAQDPASWQNTRSSWPSASQREDRDTAPVVQRPPIEWPVVTTTDLLRKRKRKGHVYARESTFLSTPTVPTSASRFACDLATTDAKKIRSSAASVVNKLDLSKHNDEGRPDAGLPSPPLSPYEEPLTRPLARAADLSRTQGPQIRRRTRGYPSTCASSKGETRTLDDPFRDLTGSDKTARAHYSRSESSYAAKSKTKTSMSKNHPNPYSTSVVEFLELGNFTSAEAAPSTPTTGGAGTRSPVTSGDGIVNLEACPTPSCTALLVREALACNTTIFEEKQGHEVTDVAGIAQDLGLAAEHIQGCPFALFKSEWDSLGVKANSLWIGKRSKESDAKTYSHVPDEHGEDGYVGQAEGSSPDGTRDMEDKVMGKGRREDAEDGLGADWMGEGLEFWLSVEK